MIAPAPSERSHDRWDRKLLTRVEVADVTSARVHFRLYAEDGEPIARSRVAPARDGRNRKAIE